MEAAERAISQVLTEQIRYEIPPFQRPYSWEKEHVEQLLEDLWEAYQESDPEYFIGSLITIERAKDALYEVVDGQQRLTTLNLLIARLRDNIEDPAAKVVLGRRILPRNELTDEEETPRLTLRQRDQSFFRRHVLDSQSITDAVLQKLQSTHDGPKMRIAENLSVIDAFCADKGEKVLKRFADYLLSRVYVVFVTTSSLKSAYRLFNVLNARGLPLSNADLIKNQLFARLGSSIDGAELEERWLELEGIVGVDRLDAFLGHHRTSIVAEKARKSLHEEFEAIINLSSADPLAFLDGVISSAKSYMRILEGDFSDATTLRVLTALRRVQFDEWIPPLLAYLNQPVADLDESEFTVLLEKITMQNWVRRLGRTARLTVYFQLINAVKAGKSANDVRNIFRKSGKDDEFKTLLNGEVYGKPFDLAVLLRLEEADQDESVTKRYNGAITIEHVLPQALKDDYWKKRFNEDEHGLWLHRLGNLVLLAGRKNYKAQYFSFDRKKEIYAEKNKKVSFDTTKQILDEPDWGASQLEARQSEIIEKALVIWGIS